MIYILIGLPLALLGVFTRSFTIKGVGSCFVVEISNLIDWGRVCFGEGSPIPQIVEFGSLAAGAMMVAAGTLKIPKGLLDKSKRQESP